MSKIYFDSEYISNSDLKRLKQMLNPGYRDPADLKAIFDFGTLFHALVLEPHKADYNHPDFELAKWMAHNFFQDPLCRKIFMDVPDLKREHEFYRINLFGLEKVRCKADFSSKILDLCGELKGLAVSSEKQLDDAIEHHDYDQAIAWYMHVAQKKNYFFAAPSKLVKRTFKRFITRDHPAYKRGMIKAEQSAKLFRETLMVKL